MPLITAKRAGACTACGGRIRKDEQAWFTAETGLRHPNPQCAKAAASAHRANARADSCSRCGATVAAGEGRLEHAGSTQGPSGWKQIWRVKCQTCT